MSRKGLGHFGAAADLRIRREDPPARKTPHRETFGKTQIHAFESRHDDEFRMRMTVRPFHKLALIRKGGGWIETPTGQVPLHEHHVLFLPAGFSHRFVDVPGDPLTLVMVSFFEQPFCELAIAGEVFGQFRQEFPAAAPYVLANRHLRAEVADSFRGMIFEQIQEQPGAALRIWGHLAELLVLLLRCSKGKEPKVSPAHPAEPSITALIAWLDRNFFEPVSVTDLAASAGLSYRRFTEGFKQATGETVVEYVTRLRVEYAMRLMLESENILDSAYSAGFGDIAHFYRTFKKMVGKTPREFLSGGR